MKKFVFGTVITVAALSVGCGEEGITQTGAPADAVPSPAAPAADQPAATAPAAGEHNRLPLGEKTVGDLKLVATMDEPVKATGGGEGAFDVVITGGKPRAVRFWVGTEDAEGSVKAKAEEETPNNWHTHAEVPQPLPPGSKFWVEVEPPTGEKFVESFDLKTQ